MGVVLNIFLLRRILNNQKGIVNFGTFGSLKTDLCFCKRSEADSLGSLNIINTRYLK